MNKDVPDFYLSLAKYGTLYLLTTSFAFFPKNSRVREEIFFISDEPERHPASFFRSFAPELLRGIPLVFAT